MVFRGVGLVRAAANVALTNLVYNTCRFTQIVRCRTMERVHQSLAKFGPGTLARFRELTALFGTP